MTLTTNCTKTETTDDTIVGEPFEIVLTPSVSKTTNDGFHTNWAAGDAVNVFHAVTGSTDYVNDGQFTISDVANGKFSGTLNGSLNSNESYDWYVFYPYISQIETPNNTSRGYSTVAAKTQTQTGNNSMVHIAELPLAGKATTAAGSSSPSVSMYNMSSVIKVIVTNNSGVALPVTSIKVTPSAEAITGTYYVSFVDPANPVYTASGASYVYKEVTLNADYTIPNGETGTFYVAVKPFTAANETTLKLRVNDYEKTSNITSDKIFAAGKINTFNFNYNQTPYVILPFTISGTDGSAGYSATGLSSSGLGSDYKNSNSPYLTKFDNTGDYVQVYYDSPAAKAILKVKMLGGGNSSSFTVKGSADGSTFNDIETLAISGSQNDILILETTNSIDDSYRFLRFVFTKGSNVGLGELQITKAAVSSDPEIQAKVVSNIPARGSSGNSVTITLNNYDSAPSLTVTPDGTIITAASVTSTSTTSATITYTIANNYTGAARAGSITVEDTDSHSATVTVNQVADEFSTTAADPLIIGNEASSTKYCSIKSDFDWTIDDSNLNGATVSPKSFTYSGNQNQSIQFTTTAKNETGSALDLGYVIVNRAGGATTLRINIQQEPEALGESLPFNWNGGRNDGTVNMTITAGTDYSSSPKVKFQTANTHCIIVRIASAATLVSFNTKQNGSSNSVITLSGSVDGSSYTKIQDFTINQGNSKTQVYTSSNSIDSSYRYLRLMLTTKGSNTNIGVGTIHIE